MAAAGREAVNRRVVERLFAEVLNGGDLAPLDELYHPDVVDHDPYPGAPPGIEGVRHSITAVLGGYTESTYTVTELTATGDTVHVRVAFEGVPTHRLLRRPGGGPVRSTQALTFVLADGLIVERRAARRPRTPRHTTTSTSTTTSATTRKETPAMSSTRHAVIAGGGIGGMAAAVALNQAGIRTTVHERSPELRAGGAGLHLWTNAMLALEHLGLDGQIRETAPAQGRCEFRTARGRLLASWPVGDFTERYGQPTVAIARSALHDALQTGLTDTEVHTGAEVTGFEQDASGVTVHLSGGRTTRADLLVGADGIGSAVRARLLGDAPPRYAGYVAWRGIADLGPDVIEPGSFCSIFGRGTRFVYYDIAPGRVHWMSVENGPPGGTDAPGVLAAIARRHRGWTRPVERIIDATDPATVIRTDVLDRAPDERWGEGRVTLLGDAAHPMTFNVGQGACMAIEDALVLAERLRHADDVPAALTAYEDERRPRTASMQKAAAVLGRLGSWSHPVSVRLREAVMRAGWERGAFRAIEKDVAYGTRWRKPATTAR